MKISIITVCRNSEKTIETTIKSVVSQTYKDIEYIIIDGNSKDRTKDIVLSYGDRISKFVSEPDKCLWEAMNKGIKLATGDFLYFINSDDYIFDENVIGDVVTFIKERPDADFVYGDIEVRTPPHKPVIQKSPYPIEIVESMVIGCSIPHAGSFIKPYLFEKIGLYNENYKIGSDYEWVTKLMQDQTLKLFYMPRVIASFFSGGLSGNIKENLTEMFEIQNNVPIYQSDFWIARRLVAIQKIYACKYEELLEARTLADERFAFIEASTLGKLLLSVKKAIKALKS
ncbi:glycosyl transferase [Synechococcus sp. PCC 7502]|uniref:glycosyltransferase family 2 protein n=1 Tax=Synechococcus sp. PCC 7502 TaxID=1173263 RepID=UPI00029FDE8F|nr:glycosyltransferase family 2 protein [Synechococcus sp. PCC 7502]AFY73438.1 glycosyl transferase [Synechococcus sp. PCC 7502]